MSKDIAEGAITDALHRYCTAVDSYDTVSFLSLWTVDAQLDFGERYQGGPAGFMASLVEARSRTIAMTHQMEETSIELSSDLASATSRSIVSAAVTRLSNDGEQRRLVRGCYEDRWVLTDGQWLMQHRRYRATSET
jgi:hypothetical protein